MLQTTTTSEEGKIRDPKRTPNKKINQIKQARGLCLDKIKRARCRLTRTLIRTMPPTIRRTQSVETVRVSHLHKIPGILANLLWLMYPEQGGEALVCPPLV